MISLFSIDTSWSQKSNTDIFPHNEAMENESTLLLTVPMDILTITIPHAFLRYKTVFKIKCNSTRKEIYNGFGYSCITPLM